MEENKHENQEDVPEEVVGAAENGDSENIAPETEETDSADVTTDNAESDFEADVTENTDEAESAGEADAAAENDAPSDDTHDETAEKDGAIPGKKKGGKKKAIIISSCAAGFLAAVYLGGAAFYSSHFFIGTSIGGTDVANMSVAKAEEAVGNDMDNYTFTFFEKGDKQETITGDEIHLTHGTAEGLEDIRSEQNPFEWPVVSFQKHTFPLSAAVTYDEDALYNRLTEMDFMADTRASIAGQAQNIYYDGGAYVISDNDNTEIISLNSLYEKVKPKIYGLYEGMSLEKENCYEPLAQEDTIKGVLNMLNKYVGTKITYLNGDSSTLLDGSTINGWITVSDDYIINIDENMARDYINELAHGYDSIGKARTFRTSGGSDVTVSGGNYGWCVNNASETAAMLDIIRSGETVEREPIYKQQARVHGANDIGSTYVEINLGAQHMWYYKNGSLVVSSDVVTGNPSKGNATPTGVYRIAYTDKNVTLKGEDYETPVSFWMPFNGGIGLHDATWRGTFGGSIYRGGGSHGCVNLPYNVAQTLFNNISPGDPVVVY